MRLFKNFIKKIYHLIWFLSAFFIVSLPVNAAVNIDGANFVQSSSVDFADNTNGHLTSVGSTWVEYGSLWRSSDSLLTTGGSYGVNVAFLSDVPFVQGHTYSVSFLIGLANGFAVTNSSSNSRVCIAENTSNAFARYNNSSFPCTTAWSTSTNTTYYFSDGQVAYQYTMLSFVFTAEYTSNAITFTYTSSSSNESNHTFAGYIIEEISSQPLTQSQIQSAVQSSGLATANSVSQVQSSINQIQTDINSSANNIINNNNNNTNNIINNQNENSDKQIESQKVCKYIDKSSISLDNKYLSVNGDILNANGVGVTNYININSSIIEVLDSVTGSANSCFYNSNKELISCINLNNTSGTITIPNKSQYFRATISKSQNRPTFNICTNGNQALNDSVNNLNDNITDSNIDSSDDTINNLKNRIPTNSVISDLLLLPVRFLQNFVNALGSSCSSFSLGSLYGTELFMPCINIESYLGSGIWTTIDLIISGLFVYSLRKKFIEIYENMTDLKNGGNEVD